MHLKKHLLAIFSVLVVLGLFYFYAISDIFHPKQIATYENFTAIGEEYNADQELQQARKKYADSREQAKVLQASPSPGQKVIALTFDGMESRGNMEAILKALQKHGWHATFFVEGSNAARESTVIQKLVQDGQELGNYSFVGIDKAERLPADRLLEQFVKTQKVLQVTSGKPGTLLKLPDTRYLPAVLRAAKASGLDYAVQSTVTLRPKELGQQGAFEKVLARLPSGSILSLRLDHPVPLVKKTKKEADVPAIDKRPTISDAAQTAVSDVPLVQLLEQFFDLLAARGYTVVPVGTLIR
ncbi:polysaccharide deacetylase family protein [Acidaminococcus sp.]|uniref:polysaccharide deacetylase family protein n=1 Tax=Acidaminococcus sp. TaxID=1872103 RepID=UPI003D7D2CD5